MLHDDLNRVGLLVVTAEDAVRTGQGLSEQTLSPIALEPRFASRRAGATLLGRVGAQVDRLVLTCADALSRATRRTRQRAASVGQAAA